MANHLAGSLPQEIGKTVFFTREEAEKALSSSILSTRRRWNEVDHFFKDKFEERMKKQFGAFENPQVYGVKSVHTEGAYLCSTISDTVRWRMADISRFYCEEG